MDEALSYKDAALERAAAIVAGRQSHDLVTLLLQPAHGLALLRVESGLVTVLGQPESAGRARG